MRWHVGDRVQILESDGVARYLHGAVGTVSDLGRDPFDPERPLVRVTLDTPRAPTDTWRPLSSIAVGEDEIGEVQS